MSLDPALINLATEASPYLLGLAVGFGTAVLGVRRWFTQSALRPSADILTGLRRIGLQYLVLGVLLAVAGSNWLAHHLDRPLMDVLQRSLWGLPLGLFAGTRWMFRRGER